MTSAFSKETLQEQMLAHFGEVYGQFPEILAKISDNYKAQAHWNRNMTVAELQQTVRLLEDFKRKRKSENEQNLIVDQSISINDTLVGNKQIEQQRSIL